MLNTLSKWSDRLVGLAATFLLLAMLTVVFLGVVFRLVGQPLAWSDELAQYLLVWTGFTGWILASRRRSHIRISVIIDRLGQQSRRVAEVLTQLLVAALGVVLLVKSFGLIDRNVDVEWVSLPLSVSLVYIPIPIAGAAVIAQALVQIAEAIRGPVSRDGGEIPL